MKRLYVLIDSQYESSYRAVQAGHAVAEYMLRFPQTEWKNHYLIYLQVDNIQQWIFNLEKNQKQFACFIEPDVGHKITAIAVEDDGKLFRKLKMN